jgi:hypothetical protein
MTDRKYGCQLFCIREREAHPQLAATSRHISCGGYELKDLSWSGNTLAGTSEIVGNDAYTLYVLETVGFTYQGFECTGAKVISNARRDLVREITLLSESSATVTWRVQY